MHMRRSDLPFANDSTPGSSRGLRLGHKFELPRDFLVESPMESRIRKFAWGNDMIWKTSYLHALLTFFNLSNAAFSFFSHFLADLGYWEERGRWAQCDFQYFAIVPKRSQKHGPGHLFAHNLEINHLIFEWHFISHVGWCFRSIKYGTRSWNNPRQSRLVCVMKWAERVVATIRWGKCTTVSSILDLFSFVMCLAVTHNADRVSSSPPVTNNHKPAGGLWAPRYLRDIMSWCVLFMVSHVLRHVLVLSGKTV
jgi:hypothetical protein